MATPERAEDVVGARSRTMPWGDETVELAPPAREWTYARFFSLRNLLLAMLLGALGGVGAGFGAMQASPVYTSEAHLLIDQPRALALSPDDAPILKLDLLKIKYANLANTPAIAGPAAAQLGLPESAVANAVTATPTEQSFLVTVAARASTRSTAVRMANAVAQSIVTYADQEQANIGVVPANRFGFSIVQRAAATTRAQPTVSHAAKAGAVLGVLLFVGAYAILQLLSAQPR